MNSLFARLLRSYVVVLLTTIAVTGAALAYLYTESVYESKERELVENGVRLARLVEVGTPTVLLRARVEAIAQTLNAGITFANREGLVTLTTFSPSREKALRLSPSDVHLVLEEGASVTRRGFEEAVQEAVVTALVPIRSPNGIAGAVVLHAPIQDTADTIEGGRRLLLVATLLAAGAGVGVSYVLSRRITEPIRQMTSASLEMAQGNFDRRVSTQEKGEVGALGNAFNELAHRLGQTIRELTQEKQKTGSILASMSEGVIAVDSEGRVLLVNPALVNLFKIEGDVVAEPLQEQHRLKVIWPHIESTLSGHLTDQTEVRLDEKVLVLHSTPLRDDDGDVQGAVAILHDVTERYQLERIRRDFLANVSHELRTPLTSIRGFVQAILEGMVVNEEQTRRYLHVIMDESLRLSRLVNTILDLSRIESNAIEMDLERLDLGEIIDDTVESLEPICKDRDIQIHVELDRLPPVQADRDWMAQIFLNLLENAVRHSPKGKRVSVFGNTCEHPDSSGVNAPYVQVQIEDEGEGIPQEDLPYIWERFYKVDKSRRYQHGVGTGLGLVIVKELVQMHNGSVEAENRAEGGARFTVRLPVNP